MNSVSWKWVLVPGILFVGMVAFLAHVASYDYKQPKRAPREGLREVAVTAEKPFDLEWPRRRGEHAAPPLSLFISQIELGSWMSGHAERVTMLTGTPEGVYFFTGMPDAEALRASSMGEGCPAGLESADCAISLLRVFVQRDLPEPDHPGRSVLGSGVRGVEGEIASLRFEAFWFDDSSKRGRLEFVGWDCPGSPPGPSVTTDLAKPLAERARCFDPGSVARRAPRLAGYERAVFMSTCSGGCKLYFPYRGRVVEVTPYNTPLHLGSEEGMRRVFLGAWEFVNRLRADARVAPSGQIRLARAAAALDNCRAIRDRMPPPGRAASERRDHLRFQCGYAMLQAGAALRERPAEATKLIMETYEVGAAWIGSLGERHVRAALEATKAAQPGESPEKARMQLAYARSIPGAQFGSETFRKKRQALEEAVRLADATLERGSEPWAESYRALVQSFYSEHEPAEKIAVLERWRAVVLETRGPADRAMIAPVFQLCEMLFAAARQDRLKQCADEYLPFWLEMVSKLPAGELTYANSDGGFALMGWYASYGLRLDRPHEVLPTIRKLAAILEPRTPRPVWERQGLPSLRLVEAKLR